MNERSKALLLLVWIEQKREYCPEQTSNKSSFKCLQAIWARSWVRNPFGTDDYFHVLICQPFKIRKELFLQPPPFRSFLSFIFFLPVTKNNLGPIFFRSRNIETKQNGNKYRRSAALNRYWCLKNSNDHFLLILLNKWLTLCWLKRNLCPDLQGRHKVPHFSFSPPWISMIHSTKTTNV